MKFPERPVATAGLGVICALALLAVLSWPALTGSFNSSYQTNTSVFTGALPATVSTLSQTKSLNAVFASTSTETTISVTVVTSYSASSANSLVSGSNSATAYSSPGVTETSVSTTNTTLQSLTTSSGFASGLSLRSNLASSSTVSGYEILALLSIISLTVAVGSTLFIRRRVSPD